MVYLRMHPLFVNISLEDIDLASDSLQMATFAPGAQIYPPKAGEDLKIYFVSEGECAVLRKASKATGGKHDIHRDSDRWGRLGRKAQGG